MQINILAVLTAALIPMILGFIWYHPKVLGGAWMRAAGISETQIQTGNMPLIFGVSFLFSLMIAFAMNTLAYHDGFVHGALYYVTDRSMQPPAGSEAAQWLSYYDTHLADTCRTFKHGAFHGFFLAGLLIILPVLGTNALFERKGFKYIMVNAGYWILCLALMGGTIAAWK